MGGWKPKKKKNNHEPTTPKKCVMKNWTDTNKGPMSEYLFDIFRCLIEVRFPIVIARDVQMQTKPNLKC